MRSRWRILVLISLALAACSEDRAVTRGAALYADHCAVCHGADKRGGGGAGIIGLSKTPPDLTLLSFRAGGTFPRAEVLAILQDYAQGTQSGRRMRPFAHLTADARQRIRTEAGRLRAPEPQVALLTYLETVQQP